MLPAKGPSFPSPLKSPQDKQYHDVLTKSKEEAVKELSYVYDAITLTRTKLEGRVPLIGFCGAPWTLLCYMVEGGGSKLFIETKKWVYRYPEESKALLQKITEVCVEYLALQVQAGAQVRLHSTPARTRLTRWLKMIQVFDSWAAELSPSSFKQFSQPYLAYISTHLPQRLEQLGLERVPMIVFAKGAWYALDDLCSLGYDVVGLDWLQEPAEAVKIRGDRKVVFQGNADPGCLYGTREAMTSCVKTMVEGFYGGKKGGKGWISNLGHGKSCFVSFLVATRGSLGQTFATVPFAISAAQIAYRASLTLSRYHATRRSRGFKILLSRGS